MTDPLSRLRAGLDRDEAIARAAAEQSPQWTDGYESEAWAGGYSDSLGEHTFGQIERQSPSRVLRQAEVFRKLLAEYDSHLVYGPPFEDSELEGNGPDIWEGRDQVFKLVFEALASIYPEDTDWTEKP